MNQKLNSRRKRLLQVEQVAYDPDQHALMVELRTADGSKKFAKVVDLPPIHNDQVKFVLLDQAQGIVTAAHNLRRHLQLVQNAARRPQKGNVGAEQQRVHGDCRLR